LTKSNALVGHRSWYTLHDVCWNWMQAQTRFHARRVNAARYFIDLVEGS